MSTFFSKATFPSKEELSVLITSYKYGSKLRNVVTLAICSFSSFYGQNQCIAHTVQYDVMLVGDLNAEVDFHFSLIANI